MIKNRYKIFITAFGFQPDYIREIANAFAATGNNVILIGNNHQAKENYAENVNFINLRGNDTPNRNFIKKTSNLMLYYFNLIKIIIRYQIRIIYDPSIGRPLLIILNYLLYKLIGRKIILTVHNVLPHGKHSSYNFLLYKIIYRVLTDHLIVHTKFLENELINKFSINKDKITVASHGTYKINTNNTLDKEKARLSLNLSINDFVILIFGQQYSYKGTHILLEKYLKSIKFDYKLLIYGSGNENYIDKLKNIINNLSFKKDIIYNFKHISQEEMELFFKSSDVVCLPYVEGSQSGVLFMSYAFGRPVLASDVGNFKYDIKSGFSGEIFEVGNSDDFENKLNKIKNNLIQYDESGIKEFAAKNYSWENFAEIIINKVYKNIRN